MAQRKIMLNIGYGQSNELGTGVAPRMDGTTSIITSNIGVNVRHTSVFGRPNVSLTVAGTPGAVSAASIFQKLAEHIALETGWIVGVQNFARGGTAVTDNWCGWDGTNKRILAPGETGYDPSSLIANTITGVTSAVAAGFEVWSITAGHQNDITISDVNNAAFRPVQQIISGSAHIQNLALAAGASKVIVGKTPRFIGGSYEAEFDPGGKIHQIAAGVIAAVPGAIAGADLTGNLDTRLCATDNLQFIHLNHAGVCWAAEKWLHAIKAAKLI